MVYCMCMCAMFAYSNSRSTTIHLGVYCKLCGTRYELKIRNGTDVLCVVELMRAIITDRTDG